MDLMKDIDKLAKAYVPAKEPIEETRFSMMQSALTAPKNVKPSDKLDLSKKKKQKKKLKEYFELRKADLATVA
jgi:hypothetical protein